ncbi:MAG: hypothetical protein PVG20_04650 [Thioalkalispiraceae bacterium]|jgi:hypothetical protein
MAMQLYVFSVDDAGQVVRIPLARWKRVLNKSELIPAFSGRRVKVAYAYIQTEQRWPVFCYRIDGVIHEFDRQGQIKRPELPPVDLLGELYRNTDKVVSFTQKLQQRRYTETNRWEVRSDMLQKIIDNIWN